MKKFCLNNILFFLIFASIFALISAYVSQYYFGFEPCKLCLYQRKPFFIIIFLCLVVFLFFKQEKYKKVAIFLSLFLLLINASIAVYHVGVEKKIFKISEGCASTIPQNVESIEQLKNLLASAPIARCDEPKFFFLSLSMAAWNIIYCTFLIIATCILYRNLLIQRR